MRNAAKNLGVMRRVVLNILKLAYNGRSATIPKASLRNNDELPMMILT